MDAAYAAADADAKGEDDGARWYLDDEGEKVFEPNTRIYSFQQGIAMDADSNGQFFVTAVAVSTERNPPQYEPSEVARFIYQLEKAESPVASPETSTSSVSVIEPNTTITLTSGTVGAEIYYTKDTTLPDVTDTEAVKKAYAEWLAGWNAASEKQRGTDARGVRWYSDASGTKQTEPSTIPYDAAEGITMPKTITTFFTLRAVAVVSDGSRANSEVVTISYQLPEKVQAVYASPIGGTAVEYGASVTLSCSTEDAQIFYKVYESEPGEDDVPVVNQDLAYTEPISITKEVWIRAVATKSGMESNVATYHYTVAPTAAAPTVSLPAEASYPRARASRCRARAPSSTRSTAPTRRRTTRRSSTAPSSTSTASTAPPSRCGRTSSATATRPAMSFRSPTPSARRRTTSPSPSKAVPSSSPARASRSARPSRTVRSSTRSTAPRRR